jgi:brefeldin A-inhibited guanine nucleotide-exchange protein
MSGAYACACLVQVGMTNLRDVFVHSLCGFTHLHSPQTMRLKNALAFQFLLRLASPDHIGNHLDDRCGVFG